MFVVSEGQGQIRLNFGPNFDHDEIRHLRDTTRHLPERVTSLLIDISQLEFLDPASVTSLAGSIHRARQREIPVTILTGCSAVRHALILAQLHAAATIIDVGRSQSRRTTSTGAPGGRHRWSTDVRRRHPSWGT